MFARLVWKMLRGGKGRLFVGLLAVASGAAVISALLNLQFDMQRKLTQEFRSLGPNIVVAPQSGAQAPNLGSSPNAGASAAAIPVLLNQRSIEAGLDANRTPDVVASAPFFFVVARANETPVVVVGTWLDQVSRLNPTWRLEGSWITQRDDKSQCLVGRNVARQFELASGSQLEARLSWPHHAASRRRYPRFRRALKTIRFS